MSQTQNSFSNNLLLDLKRAKQSEANFNFYQSSESESLYNFAFSFAKKKKMQLKHIRLQSDSIYAPFAALFSILIQGLDESPYSAEEVVCQATNYTPLQKKLTAILKNEIYQRKEMPIIDDLFFEKQEITESIINLISILIKKPLIVVISCWHYASTSSIELLKIIATKNLNVPLMVMVSIDTQYALANRQDDEAWEDFLDWLDDTNLLHRVPSGHYKASSKWRCSTTSTLTPKLLAQNASLMAWPEVIALTNFLLDDPSTSTTFTIELRLRLAEAYLFSGDLNAALNELKSLQVFQERITTLDDHIRLFSLLSLTLVQRQSHEEAMQCAEVALDIAKRSESGLLLAQSLFINFYAHDKASTQLPLAEFKNLDQQLQHYSMHCSHIYILRNYYSYLGFYKELDSKTALEITQKGIQLAEEVGHRQGVAASYHSKGIIYSYINDYQATFKCFAISSQIREQLGEASERLRMHNGTGYFNTLLEQYQEAQAQYFSAYNITRETSDYAELFVTLYNFSWLYFCTRDYKQATDILEQLVRICRIMKITHFPFRNLYDVFSLKGLCHTKLGELRSAQLCLDKIEKLPFKSSTAGQFLQALLKGSLYAAYGDLQQAREILEQAPALLSELVAMDTYLLPRCNIELLEIYSRQGDWQACPPLLESGLTMCKKLSLPRLTETFTFINQQIKLRTEIDSKKFPIYPLPEISLHLDELLRNAKQVNQLRQAQQRLREIQLVSCIQSLPARFDTTQKLADESLRLVCENFTIQTGMIHHFDGEQWVQWSQVGNPISSIHVKSYLKQITKTKNAWINNRFCSQGEGGKRATYDSVACFPIFIDDTIYGAVTLCNFNRNRYFNRQDEDVLSLITNQLGSQLQQLKHQENLLKMSTTDPLTSLFNRQALLARLEHELLLYEQHIDTYQCSLAYIDLDNFKMINDLLGHDVGDKILKAFSRLLVETMRTGDIVARWGGDEFVVLFPNINRKQAQMTGKRLLNNLRKKNFFKTELKQWTDKPELVADLADLSCSIGISDCSEADYDQLNEDWLLKQADRALYRAKAAGKGQVMLAIEAKQAVKI